MQSIYPNSIVVSEFAVDIDLMKNARDIPSLAIVETVHFDTPAAYEYGRVRMKLKRAGTPIGDRDTFIASHAKAPGLTLVTNNAKEFRRVEGLQKEDWMETQRP